ncbi:palmitoyltransferase ZDHHC5-B-like [Heptranchias perlo]|uniref:palmitoyltransferase ZDHHC5-B-like n=1 Tax=Heptranchias perlo TaxID=212740 RepID=UPI0035596315
MNACIGKRNYRFFFLLLLSLLVFIQSLLAFCLAYVFLNSQERYTVEKICTLILVCLSGVIVFPLFYFFVFHFRLVWTGKTTYEQYIGLYKSKPSPFSQGCLKNFRLMLFSSLPPSHLKSMKNKQTRSDLQEQIPVPVAALSTDDPTACPLTLNTAVAHSSAVATPTSPPRVTISSPVTALFNPSTGTNITTASSVIALKTPYPATALKTSSPSTAFSTHSPASTPTSFSPVTALTTFSPVTALTTPSSVIALKTPYPATALSTLSPLSTLTSPSVIISMTRPFPVTTLPIPSAVITLTCPPPVAVLTIPSAIITLTCPLLSRSSVALTVQTRSSIVTGPT